MMGENVYKIVVSANAATDKPKKKLLGHHSDCG